MNSQKLLSLVVALLIVHVFALIDASNAGSSHRVGSTWAVTANLARILALEACEVRFTKDHTAHKPQKREANTL